MQNTTITDIDIPFGRMVSIILKFMLASIPAVILLYLIIGLFTVLMMTLFGGAFALFKGGEVPSIPQSSAPVPAFPAPGGPASSGN